VITFRYEIRAIVSSLQIDAFAESFVELDLQLLHLFTGSIKLGSYSVHFLVHIFSLLLQQLLDLLNAETNEGVSNPIWHLLVFIGKFKLRGNFFQVGLLRLEGFKERYQVGLLVVEAGECVYGILVFSASAGSCEMVELVENSAS
jgi:hypothetical protein